MLHYPQELTPHSSPVEGRIMVSVSECLLPYDFMDTDNCCKFIEDKCYDTVACLSFLKREKGHLDLRCPLTGEFLTVYASEEDLNYIDEFLIQHNLYRRGTRSS